MSVTKKDVILLVPEFVDPSTVAYLKAKSRIAVRKIVNAMGSNADPNILIPLSAKQLSVPRPIRLPVLTRLIENAFAKLIIKKWLEDKSCTVEVHSGPNADGSHASGTQTQLLDDDTRKKVVEEAVELEQKDLLSCSSSKILYQNLAGQLLNRQLGSLVDKKYSNAKMSDPPTFTSSAKSAPTSDSNTKAQETKTVLEKLYTLMAKNESKPEQPRSKHESSSPKMSYPTANHPFKRMQPKKTKEPSSEETARVESQVRKFIEKYLEPMLSADIISEAVFNEVVNRTTRKVILRHEKCCTADFLLDEGDKIKTLVKEYVRHVRSRIGDIQS